MSQQNRFSDEAGNIVENAACRLAEVSGGRLTANHLVPYLPISLGLIESCLEGMVDGTAVVSEEVDNIVWYEFPALRGKAPAPGRMSSATCVSCDADLGSRSSGILCKSCGGLFTAELNRLAETIAWPAQAVYEHEILYLAAAQGDTAVRPETLAGHSRYTLRRMRRKLERLAREKRVREQLDADGGAVTYVFPAIEYPRRTWQGHMRVICGYPASLAEEVEIKLVRIILSLAVLLLGCFALAFCGVPFPVLVLGYLVTGPLLAFGIWRHRRAMRDE